MADNRLAEAVDIVARGVITRLVEWDLDDAWGSYLDELGEHDWGAVRRRVVVLLSQSHPDPDAYEAACRFLASRAENDA